MKKGKKKKKKKGIAGPMIKKSSQEKGSGVQKGVHNPTSDRKPAKIRGVEKIHQKLKLRPRTWGEKLSDNRQNLIVTGTTQPILEYRRRKPEAGIEW